MPVTIERVENEPIVISTFTGRIQAEDLAAFFTELEPIIDRMEGPIYLVSYIPFVEYSADDLVALLHLAKARYIEAQSNPTQTILFVGSSALVRIYKDALTRPEFGGVSIPMFDTLDAALAYIREQQHTRSTNA